MIAIAPYKQGLTFYGWDWTSGFHIKARNVQILSHLIAYEE